MLHKIEMLDAGHWKVDDYEIKPEKIEGGGVFWTYYIARDSSGEQVTDVHTIFENCLWELILHVEYMERINSETD